MSINFQRHYRATFMLVGFAALVAAVALPFASASCATQMPRADEPAAFERLRVMTRGGVIPADSVLASLEADYAGSRAGALARLVRARARIAAGDFAGAASLLDAKDFRAHTNIADYALFMRAEALDKAGRGVEARAAYEQLVRDFPDSMRAREALLRAANMALESGGAAAVPVFVKKLTDADDPAALLLAARAYEQTNDPVRALQFYRRLYFYAPASNESDLAATALARLNSSTAPATPDEALARAERFYGARRYTNAADAYAEAINRFPQTSTPEVQLRRGLAAYQAKRAPETLAALSSIPTSAGEMRAEALYTLTQHHARSRAWEAARTTAEELRRTFPQSPYAPRAFVAAGQMAKEAKNNVEALNFFRTAVAAYPNSGETAGAQFELAWAAHEARNFQESSRLLVEHLANYADKNTDNRGKAGYWAARDSERAGQLAQARSLYQAMLARYEANWYGYLAKQRLEAIERNQTRLGGMLTDEVERAVANLSTVTVADETAGAKELAHAARADQLDAVGLDDAAHAELDAALKTAPLSPRLNLAKARIHRAYDENVEAINLLKRSFPDYSQMKPEEMTREEWDVFYPLAYWDIIRQEARAKRLDPFMVAGLIRQESVFSPRAASHAAAYGLMQLLIPTASTLARREGVGRSITREVLFEPPLNIKLGTQYLRDNLDKFGRIEYVAAAYNAGPGRAVQWRASLPAEMDEWAEAVPFRETRGYVQGVVRNMLQYRRLYDEQGRFRPEVGTRAPRRDITQGPAPQANENTRPRRVSNEEEE
ncbi:MAG TPA: transglycosylase SLT domain-containing protein [Pyrinomonadaceae bacterium]|nr:transglycosylase SLT domain-containing protein [Pyrinomonadaceae bacterium]